MGSARTEAEVMFSAPPRGVGDDLTESLYHNSLPEVHCSACGALVMRRRDRVTIRASWRPSVEYLCPECWKIIVQWASRFALQQMELPL